MSCDIKTLSTRFMSENVATDLFISIYTNKIMIFVTQTGTVGTIISSKLHIYNQKSLIILSYIKLISYYFLIRNSISIDGETVFNIKTLFGKRDDDILYICAKRISETILNAGLQMSQLHSYILFSSYI